MRRIRHAALVTGVLLAALPALRSWSQVQIVRELPPAGDNQAQAQWGPPLPSAQAPAPERGAQFGGRVAVGGSGGQNDSGARTLDAFLESNLSLLVPFGGTSSFLLSGDAARRPSLEGMDQTYKGNAKLTFDTWQAEVGGGFHQQDRNEATGSTGELAGDVHASVNMGVIPTLPLSASYSFQRLTQNQSDFTGAFARITDSATHQAQLKAAGTLGTVGLDTGTDFSDTTDYATGMKATVFGGKLGVTVPLTSYLKVFATSLPNYNRTVYAPVSGNPANTVENTSLENDAGFLFPLSEQLSFKVGAGRIDQWSIQTGPSAYADPAARPRSVTWKGLTGVEWKQAALLSASATYGFGKTESGPFVHSFDTLFGYHGEKESFVKDAAAGGSDVLSLDDSGMVVDNQASWRTSASIGNQDALALAASYSGSADGISQPALTNMAHVGLTHQVIPEISYALSGDLTNSQGPNVQPTLLQSYQGRLTLAPRLGDRTVTFTADDVLGIDVLMSPTLLVSRAGTGVAVPVFTILSARYRFDWEWDSATAPGAGPDSAYKNTVGLTLGGDPLPFSLTTEYAFSSGFRGLRHDGTASLSATLWKGFVLTGSVMVSEYDAGSGPTFPFITTISGAYSF